MKCLLSGYFSLFLQIGVLIITVLRLVCAVIYIFSRAVYPYTRGGQ